MGKDAESVLKKKAELSDMEMEKWVRKVKRVLRASDLALVTTEWSFSGTGSNGKRVDMTAKSADVLRQQPDGTWRFVIDNPWGTD